MYDSCCACVGFIDGSEQGTVGALLLLLLGDVVVPVLDAPPLAGVVPPAGPAEHCPSVPMRRIAARAIEMSDIFMAMSARLIDD